MHKVIESHGDWVFITPIGNLVLTDAVNKEFKVDRVHFVSKEKLPRIRKRLGFFEPLSAVKNFDKSFFESAETFAVVRWTGKPAEIRNQCFRLVRDELSIVALSQLGYKKRRFTGRIGVLGEHLPLVLRNVFLNTENPSKAGQSKAIQSPSPLVLDEHWKVYQREMYYTKLISILANKKTPDPQWHKALKRACVLAGESFNSNDVPSSFLWNMIALELLLKDNMEKYASQMPKMLEAFVGWIGFWDTENYEQRIEQVYKKRNKFVHEGDRESISKRDLLFTDDLLLNMLLNIVNLWPLFDTRTKVIEFARKVEAEHTLGIPSKVRPKKLTFVSRTYSKEDFDEI